MKNLKFYHVEIGNYSRRGDLIVHNSFVCKSEKSNFDVQRFYSQQYSGFGVRINEITTVLAPEILVEKEDQENIDLKNELKALKSQAHRRLKGTISFKALNEENRNVLRSLLEKESEFNELKLIMKLGIKKQIEEKYAVFMQEVRIDKNIDSNLVESAEYTVILRDELH